MSYPTDQELIDQAAAAGFTIGDYAHSPRRDHRAAMQIICFEQREGVLGAVLMNRCCFFPLPELRRSTGHQRGPQFGPDYKLVTSGPLLFDVLRRAEVSTHPNCPDHTGAWVKELGTEQPEVWLTSAPRPHDPDTVFCFYTNAPWPTDPQPAPAQQPATV